MRTLVIASAVALAFVAADASYAAAQETPSFAGSWTLEETTGAPGGGGGPRGGMGMFGGVGEEATITQDEEALTIVRSSPMGEIETTYNLDGSESHNTLQLGGNRIDLVSEVQWDGERLVVTTPITFGGGSAESRMTLSLDESGNLVVESSTTGGPGGGRTIRSVYTEG